MPDNFRVRAIDRFVQGYPLQAALIQRIQISDNFTFEFHGGHTQGNPVYVRVNDNKDNSNVPKFDTLNKSAADYPSYQSLANAGKLDLAKKNKQLSKQDLDEISALIVQNFEFFQKLAAAYY